MGQSPVLDEARRRRGLPTAVLRAVGLLVAISAATGPSAGQTPQPTSDTLAELRRGFEEPPPPARPRVWWHWIDSNITREGITADLEWMTRVGIGGFQLFDVGVGVAQYVDDPPRFMTPEWLDLVDHAAREAKRLGLEMTLHAAGGWSQTGGPWVEPHQGMKKYTWSETHVRGPATFTGPLPAPTSATGPYRDFPADPPLRLPRLEGSAQPLGEPGAPAAPTPPPTHYADQHVFAFQRTPQSVRLDQTPVTVTASTGPLDAAALRDGVLAVAQPLSYGAEGTAIEFDFERPVAVNALHLSMHHEIPPGLIQTSDDGERWRTLSRIEAQAPGIFILTVRTVAFPETVSSRLRILLTGPPQPNLFRSLAFGMPPASRYQIAELAWRADGIHRFEEKAGFSLVEGYRDAAVGSATAAVASASVVDLTDRLLGDGSLVWDVPEGDWTIVRLGHSLTGVTNHPATEEARGLEVDKLHPDHVRRYLDGLLGPIAERSPDTFGKGGIEFLLLDSYEARQSTWTEGILASFEARRGYDPRPYLPTLLGHVVDGVETTERFLWDWRLTISELFRDGHNRTIQRYANERGLGVYAQSMGTNQPTMANGMELKAMAEVPVAEFWFAPPDTAEEVLTYRYLTDVREAASVAHVYGQNLVAVEAFTTRPTNAAPWAQGPKDLKWVADYYFAEGMNRPVIHSSDHQPLDDFAPGFTLLQFGQFLTRHETWAEPARHWIRYLARTSHLLQHGRHVADLALFLGEGAPATVPFWERFSPAPPEGYEYDYVDATTVLERLRVENGELVTPTGMRYRALVLDRRETRLTLPLARRLAELVEEGAVLVAPRPAGTPSLADGPDANEEIARIADRLWGDDDTLSVTSRRVGRGAVHSNADLDEVLASLGVAPDVRFERSDAGDAEPRLKWLHRTSPGADLYFVANLGPEPVEVQACFRSSGRKPELWWPETARIEPASFQTDGARTEVPLELATHESVFVVFGESTELRSHRQPRETTARLATVDWPWTVSFLGAEAPPAPVTFEELVPWNESDDERIRYYSGTAVYSTTIDAPADWLEGEGRLVLDLGGLDSVAEVRVNGEPLGADWMPPYRVELTGLTLGENRLEIEVTNLWANRLIGDARVAAEDTVAEADFRPFHPDTLYMTTRGIRGEHPLFPSGLHGPVRILRLLSGEHGPGSRASN